MEKMLKGVVKGKSGLFFSTKTKSFMLAECWLNLLHQM